MSDMGNNSVHGIPVQCHLMETKLTLTTIELTRQERLDVWMSRNGVTYKRLGALMGITGANAARLLKAETMPPQRYEQVSKIIPAVLLPKSQYLKPGPKPKTEIEAA